MRVIFFKKWSNFNLDLKNVEKIIMVRVLAFRFQQCLGLFTMSPVEGSTEAGLFRHLSKHVFRSQ